MPPPATVQDPRASGGMHGDVSQFERFRGRGVVIFEPYRDFATNPSLVSLSTAMARAGAHVDVLMPHDDRVLSEEGLVTRRPFPYPTRLWHTGLRSTVRGWVGGLRRTGSRHRLHRMFAANRYDLILAVDSDGVISARRYARRYGVPLVYLSFEIFFLDELTSAQDIRHKHEEVAASRDADLVLVQDGVRGKLLADENGIEPGKIAFLPVAPSGAVEPPASNFLRERFGIAASDVVVLHSGGLGSWTYAEELLESVATWPPGFVLVVHTKYRPDRGDRYAEMFRDSGLPSVRLSTEPMPDLDYQRMVASADIGLVLYKSDPNSIYTQRNIETIGLASGKFSVYAKCGLPIISLNQPTYESLLTDYDFGVNLTSMDEISGALVRLASNRDRHSSEARRLFAERLDFDAHWPDVASRLLAVAS